MKIITMKKTVLALFALTTVVGGAMVLSSGNGSKTVNLSDQAIDTASLMLAKSKVAKSAILLKAAESDTVSSGTDSPGVTDPTVTTVDLWNNVSFMYGSQQPTVVDSNTLQMVAGEEEIVYSIIGTFEDDGETYYAWYGYSGYNYTFSGTLTSDDDVLVFPCIIYLDKESRSWITYSSGAYDLNEENNHTLSFNLGAKFNDRKTLGLAFMISGTEGATVTAADIEFSYSITSPTAQKWSEENDLPGLGLNGYYDPENAYIVALDDGATTLGLRLNGSEVVITGINTTATEVTLPETVFITDTHYPIIQLGDNSLSWEGAQSLKVLHLNAITDVGAMFDDSNISDIYISNETSFSYSVATKNGDVYLHIPYGMSRYDYQWSGFTRVLVGEEQSFYPETTNSDYVIAGENDNEFFGIQHYSGNLIVSEIFTQNDTITLPDYVPYADGLYYVYRLGNENNIGTGTLTANAPNLKSVTVPAHYHTINVNWSRNSITELHMQGDVPSTNWSLDNSMIVYVGSRDAYNNYMLHSSWNNAVIQPQGWDFEWMTLDVKRRGEFAQDYIELTDADWGAAMYLKVTGVLNETDLKNMKNLTALRKLDLSEADMPELPANFMSDKQTLMEVSFPESLKVIASGAFNSCRNLTTVNAPGVTYIRDRAFNYCNKLTDFDISKVTYLGSYAFRGCNAFNPESLSQDPTYIGDYDLSETGITIVDIPEGIIRLENYAFYKSTNLTSVKLPLSLEEIGSYVFQGCTSLSDITFNDGLKTIGQQAFLNCSALKTITLNEGVTTINNSAFSGCESLETITLPSTLASIGSGALSSCISLHTVTSKAIVPPVASGFMSYVDLNHCTLYVAPFAIDAYREAAGWKDFYIMKSLQEPVKNIYIDRPMVFNLLSEDNAVLQDNPNMTLSYTGKNSGVGQLYAEGDGTLSAGVFTIRHRFDKRQYGYYDCRTTLINNAENMRADSVLCSIELEKNIWHFISFQYDVQMADIHGINNTDFVVRKYNSEKRATGDGLTSNWEDVPADGILEAGKGYIIQVANNTSDSNGNSQQAVVCFPSRNTVTKNRLFTSNNVIVPLEEYPAEFAHNRSWNLVGNPYPCYYDMHSLMEDFTTPIVLWRGSNYQAYSPVDDDIILRPNEAFFVQRPLDAENMVFGVEGRMNFDDAEKSNLTPGSKAPARIQANGQRSVFNFNVAGCGSDDRARVVMNEEASAAYEIERDAAKFFADAATGVEVYVDDAVKYDICERPLGEGTARLGMRFAIEGEYTISLGGRGNEGWTVMLTDNITGLTTDLTAGDYSFSAKAGKCENRFTLSFKAPDHSSVSAIEAAEGDSPVKVINTAGIVVFEGRIADFNAPAAGVYVVAGVEKAYKVVIK